MVIRLTLEFHLYVFLSAKLIRKSMLLEREKPLMCMSGFGKQRHRTVQFNALYVLSLANTGH